MKVAGVRGLILEEIVLYLLAKVGYRLVRPGEEATRPGKAGLEVQGRGEWHQIDALAAFDHTPAFMYPLRLMVEAKCYAEGRAIGIEVARNAVGVLKDITENYFVFHPTAHSEDSVQVPRFNYHAAVFSSSGYTRGAQRYAVAHQIFLIQYDRVALLAPVIEAIRDVTRRHLDRKVIRGAGHDTSYQMRLVIRQMLGTNSQVESPVDTPFSQLGTTYLQEKIIAPLYQIGGSYFGMLQGKWPMHLLSKEPLPAFLFESADAIRCKVYGRKSDHWSFSPSALKEGDEGWFRLEFDIPGEIAGLVASLRSDPIALAQIKQQQFSFLDLAGKIGGVYRQVRLELDEPWLEEYVAKMKRRAQQDS